MAATINDDEFEYYEYDETQNGDGIDYNEDVDDDDAYWYYDEVDEAPKAPPASVLALIQRQYSQRLVLDPIGSVQSNKLLAETPKSSAATLLSATSPSPTAKSKAKSFRYRKRNQLSTSSIGSSSIGTTSSTATDPPQQSMSMRMESEESRQIAAISVFKAFLQRQRLDTVQGLTASSDLNHLAAILEAIWSSDPSIPSFIVTLFRTSCDNMFGALDLDLDALNNDFNALKPLFIDNDTDELRFGRNSYFFHFFHF